MLDPTCTFTEHHFNISTDPHDSKSTEVSRPVPYDLDLGHLAVFDVNVLDTEILQQEPANSYVF